MRTPVLTIDLAAVRQNYAFYRARCEAVAAVVKANAYGLGVEPVARTLFQSGCHDFFVATVREAVDLRVHLPTARIFTLAGPITLDDVQDLVGASIVPVSNDVDQLGLCRGSLNDIAVHVDTGINRLGFRGVESVVQAVSGFNVVLAMTHPACADDPEDPSNARQIAAYESLVTRFPGAIASYPNSAAAHSFPRGMARIGLSLTGASPFADDSGALAPAAVFEAPVIAAYGLRAGEGVGYGATYVAKADERVAVIAAGYADGVRRALSNRGYFMTAGHKLAIRGRISMDLTVVDVPEGVNLHRGDVVEWFGRQQSLEAVARDAGVVNYEILTGMGARVERRYVNG